MNIWEHLEQLVWEQQRARLEALEHMCEVMLVTEGSPGIMYNNEYVWLDTRVPFGQIWDVTACPNHRPDPEFVFRVARS